MQATTTPRWRFKGPEMEGAVARWYAKVRGSGGQLAEYRRQAAQLTEGNMHFGNVNLHALRKRIDDRALGDVGARGLHREIVLAERPG